MHRTFVQLVLACVSAAAPLMDATTRDGTPWDGSWKLDPARSQLTGETFSYIHNPNGTWTVSNGGPVYITFSTNGKAYRSFSDDETVTVTSPGPNRWTFSRQYQGTTWDVSEDALSQDGNTITSRETVTNPDHTTTHVTTIFKRVGDAGGSGFAGKWMSVQIIGRYQSGWVFANRFVFRTTGPNTITFSMPDDSMTVEAKLDGSPVQLGGPEDKANVFFRITRKDPRKFEMAVWRDGKEERDYRMELGADGKTFTSTSWAPGKTETRTALYVKE